ncbi:hypothetical protein V6N13_110425 [Hibiscus sabdariffa]
MVDRSHRRKAYMPKSVKDTKHNNGSSWGSRYGVLEAEISSQLDSIGVKIVPNILKGDANRALLPTDRSPVMDMRRPYTSDVTNQDGSRPLVEQ